MLQLCIQHNYKIDNSDQTTSMFWVIDDVINYGVGFARDAEVGFVQLSAPSCVQFLSDKINCYKLNDLDFDHDLLRVKNFIEGSNDDRQHIEWFLNHLRNSILEWANPVFELSCVCGEIPYRNIASRHEGHGERCEEISFSCKCGRHTKTYSNYQRNASLECRLDWERLKNSPLLRLTKALETDIGKLSYLMSVTNATSLDANEVKEALVNLCTQLRHVDTFNTFNGLEFNFSEIKMGGAKSVMTNKKADVLIPGISKYVK